MEAKSIIGEKIGKLTVLSESHIDNFSGRNRMVYKCLCDCGNTKFVHRQLLVTKGCKSCGCLLSTDVPNINRKRAKIKPGAKFGKLTIISESVAETKKKSKKYYVNCICECGRTRKITTSYLSSKGVDFDCGYCGKFVRGVRVSKIQRKIYKNLGLGVLNYKYDKYCLDIALRHKKKKIAIEYNGWYWHKKLTLNNKRDKEKENVLLKNGWNILYINSSRAIPDKKEVYALLDKFDENTQVINFTLHDWS